MLESAKLYSLADVLVSCVNSNGIDASCSSLFADFTPAGGTVPADTFGAALSVVRNPGNNVANIFTKHVGATPPFPALAAGPNDWTMGITYSTDNQSSVQLGTGTQWTWRVASRLLRNSASQIGPLLR
jgi:hypothetical protein